ncbi:MAG: Uma2 family endonuclease, partial [Microcystaceae cyanobacterium]
ELRSKTDQLKDLQDKMLEYLDAGLRLGWLINPQQQQVEIYRPNQDQQVILLPANLSGAEVLPNFSLDVPLL